MLHFQFLGHRDAPRVKIQVLSKSPDHVQPLESSNYKFEPSKNNILSSLRVMEENSGRHEQVLYNNMNDLEINVFKESLLFDVEK